MTNHTGWLLGNLLFERFAAGLSQAHLVSFWFVSEIQGCQCLLPWSTSGFISSTRFGTHSLVKHFNENDLTQSGEKMLSQVYMHLNPNTRTNCVQFWRVAQAFKFFIRLDQHGAKHSSAGFGGRGLITSCGCMTWGRRSAPSYRRAILCVIYSGVGSPERVDCR